MVMMLTDAKLNGVIASTLASRHCNFILIYKYIAFPTYNLFASKLAGEHFVLRLGRPAFGESIARRPRVLLLQMMGVRRV